MLITWSLVLSLNAPVASAMKGQAVIDPIESNITGKFWVISSSDNGSSSPASAFDDNLDTAWRANDRTAGHWLMLDLGGVYNNLHKSEVIFLDSNAAYQYVVEASTDGKHWEKLINRSDNKIIAEGFVDLFSRPGTRYLRLTVTGVTAGTNMGIKEWRVFNYLRENIVNGADMSYVDQFSFRNYYMNPNPQLTGMGAGPHVLDVVKELGMRFIRLRIWNEPREEDTGALSDPPYISPARSAVVATWIKARGLQLGIDFHYADSWADPAKQPKPHSWAALKFNDLVAALYDFTYDYIKLLVDQGTAPDKVAIGNEIIHGFLWGSESAEMDVSSPHYVINDKALYWSQPGGGLLWKYWNSSDPIEQQKYEQAWDRFSTLVAAGIRAVRAASPDTAVEIHIVNDKDKLPKTVEFWNQLLTRLNTMGVDPDILALSYYPQWHGTYEDLEQALYSMASTYPQYKIEIAETAYPATGESTPVTNANQPRTIQGQAEMLKRTIQAANDIINNQGTGVLVWEPQSFQPMFGPVKNMPNYFEPFASLEVYKKVFARHILQNNIYITASRRGFPALPETVQMLSLSNLTMSAVPVTWNITGPSRLESNGRSTITGVTEYGNVTAWITGIRNNLRFFKPQNIYPR